MGYASFFESRRRRRRCRRSGSRIMTAAAATTAAMLLLVVGAAAAASIATAYDSSSRETTSETSSSSLSPSFFGSTSADAEAVADDGTERLRAGLIGRRQKLQRKKSRRRAQQTAATAATTLIIEEEEVAFASSSDDGLVLEGTLRLPARGGATTTHPGVVLVHGSGPNSRDELVGSDFLLQFGFQVPVFRDIAVALAQRANAAVLTYDKRTCGPFNSGASFCPNNSYPVPDAANTTADSFIQDAVSAVRYLQGRPEVEPDKIVVVGHSQAAKYVPVMMALPANNESGSAPPAAIQAGVMMSGPFMGFFELSKYQFEFGTEVLAQRFGVNVSRAFPGLVEQQLQGLAEIEAIKNGTDTSSPLDKFWNSLFRLDEEASNAAKKLNARQSLLILHGETDLSVPSGEASKWSDFLRDSNARVRHSTKVLPCVSHTLNCFRSFSDIGRNVDSQVIDALVEFVIRNVIITSDASVGGDGATDDTAGDNSPGSGSAAQFKGYIFGSRPTLLGIVVLVLESMLHEVLL